LKSVWFRQPVFLRSTQGNAMSLEEQLDRSQWPAFVRGLCALDRAIWINHPQATYLAESKPYQLRAARRHGFKVPRTIVTNDVEALSTELLGDPFVIKSVDTILLQEDAQEIFAYTSIVNLSDCSDPDFHSIPAICQQLLDPKKDLRVTVIGQKVYGVDITTAGNGIQGDWRLTKKELLRYTDIVISEDERRRFVGFIRQLGLYFGAIDMVRTSTGDYFIEVNPTGEWGWLDGPSRPISKDLARLLVDPKPTYHGYS